MKKIIIIFFILLIKFNLNAQSFTVVNHTCGVIKMGLFGHTPTYNNCMELQVQAQFNSFGGTTSTTSLPFNAGPCWLTQNTQTTVSGNNFTPDGVKFEANDNNGCIEYGAIGGCGGLSTTFNGNCHFCGGLPLDVTWVETGGNITITIN